MKQILTCADIWHVPGPRPINMQSHEMKDGTTMHATCTPCPVKDTRGHAKASGERTRLTAGNISLEDADSTVVSAIILTGITIALCAFTLTICLGYFGGDAADEEKIPELLKITDILHVSGGKLTYAGIVILRNTGGVALTNKDIGATLHINNGDTLTVIETLYAHDFIPTHHSYIRLIGGPGTSRPSWGAGETGYFDFSDELIHPGDLVRIDVFDRRSGNIISQSEMIAPAIT